MKSSYPYGFLRRFLLGLLCLASLWGKAQVRVHVHVTDNNFSGLLSNIKDLAEKTVVSITNTAECDIQVESISGSLLRADGSGIRTRNRIALNSIAGGYFLKGMTTPIPGAELSELFNINDFEFIGTAVRTDGSPHLVAGDYTFCISVYGTLVGGNCGNRDPNQPLNPPNSPGSCVRLHVENYQPPPIVQISANGPLPLTTSGGVLALPPTFEPGMFQPLTIRWNYAIGSRGPAPGVGYDVFVLELPPNDNVDPNQAYTALMDWAAVGGDRLPGYPFFIQKRVVGANNLTLMANDVPPEGFVPGRRYVVGVRAVALNSAQELAILNHGFGAPLWFTYGSLPVAAVTSPLTLTAYPPNDIYMPFRGMPLIVKYEPYHAAYNSFQSSFTLSSHLAMAYSYTRPPLRWPRDPIRDQSSVVGEPLSQLAAQHIIVSAPPSDPSGRYNHHDFSNRGNSYHWEADVEMGVRGQTGGPLRASIRGQFTAGMGPPQLLTPANNAAVTSGTSLSLAFKTSQEPTLSLLPPVEVSQGRSRSMALFPIYVDEKWVLEVARDPAFSTIVTTQTGVIQGNYKLGDSWPTIAADLYKHISVPVSLTATGTYYWRVKWMVQPHGPSQYDYSLSDVRQFTIGTPSDSTTTPPGSTTGPVAENDPVSSDCRTACSVVAGGSRESLIVEVGQRIRIGVFTLQVDAVSGGTDQSGYNGTGKIIDFRDETTSSAWPAQVEVEFSGLKRNELRIAHSGEVKAKGGGPASTVIQLLTAAGQGLGLVQGEALRVPFGYNETIDGVRIALILKEIKFLPEKAVASVEIGYDINKDIFAGHPLVFEATDICLKRGGFGDAFKIGLARDVVIGDTTLSRNKYAVYLSGNATSTSATSGTATEKTVLAWNCLGFEYLQLAGKVVFPRNSLIPETSTDERSTVATDLVEAHFNLRLDRTPENRFGFITNVTFNKTFQFTDLPGFGFTVQHASLDLSDGANPDQMQFPANYDYARLGDEAERLRDTWTGFYLKELTVKLPKVLTGENRPSVALTNVLIDRSGFSASLFGKDILTNGSNFGLSIDTLSLAVLQSASVNGRMTGRIALPVFDGNDKLQYSTALTFAEGNLNYNFLIKPKGEGEALRMSLWAARVTLKNTSSVEFKIGTNQKAQLKASLHGSLGIDPSALNGINLDMTGIEFENFGFDTENANFFTFSNVNREGNKFTFVTSQASPQHSAGGFGITIDNVEFDPNGGASGRPSGYLYPKLSFTTKINLSDELNGQLGLDLIGKLKITTSPSFRVDDIGLAAIDLNDIAVNLAVSGFELCGRVKFIRDDPRLGNGVYGQVCAKIPIGGDGLKAQFKCLFGNKGVVGAADYFNYWYVDGSVTFPSGLPIFSGINLYGFGGGAYHHMAPKRRPEAQAAGLLRPAAGGTTGATNTAAACNCTGAAGTSATADVIGYEPDKNTSFGIMASLVLGTMPTSDVFNMELKLEASFNPHGGLNQIAFEGKGQLMTSISNQIGQDSSSIKASADVSAVYRNSENPSFDFTVNVYVNILNSLKGVGENDRFVNTTLHADREKWWFYMGEPQNRAGLSLGLDIAGQQHDIARLNSYLMVGHNIPTELPALPPRLQAILDRGHPQGRTLNNAVYASDVNQTRQLPLTGTGFAFGSQFELNARLPFAIFYAQLYLGLGFDINLTQSNARRCAETNTVPGVNGWYAQGQMYAGLEGSMGIHVDLAFAQGDFEILKVGAAIKMVAKLPAPDYFQGRAALYYSILNGAIQGHCNFNIELGQQCTAVDPNPLSSFPIISDLKPGHGDTHVSVFTDVRATFNLKMDETLELVQPGNDGESMVRTFQPFVKSFVLKRPNGTLVPTTPAQLVNGFEAVIGVTGDALEGRRPYTTQVEVGVYETTNNTRRLAGEQAKTAIFTTGDRPDVIPESQATSAYPIQQQAYFLQNEAQNARFWDEFNGDYRPGRTGFLLTNRVAYLFAPAQKGPATSFVVRYTPESGPSTTSIEVPLQFNAQTGAISYPIPQLTNQQTYRVEFIKRQGSQTGQPAKGAPLAAPNKAYVKTGTNRQTNNAVIEEVDAAGNLRATTYSTDLQVRNNRLSGNSVREIPDKILYHYRFGTSRYNTFAEKMATFTISGVRSGTRTDLQYEVGEPFDLVEAEANGLIGVSLEASGSNEQFRYIDSLIAVGSKYRSYTKTDAEASSASLKLPRLYAANREITHAGDEIQMPKLDLNPHVSYNQRQRFLPGTSNRQYVVSYSLHVGLDRLSVNPLNTLSQSGGFAFSRGLTPRLNPLPTLSEAPVALSENRATNPSANVGNGSILGTSDFQTVTVPHTNTVQGATAARATGNAPALTLANANPAGFSALFANTASRNTVLPQTGVVLTNTTINLLPLSGNLLSHTWQAAAVNLDNAVKNDLITVLNYADQNIEMQALPSPVPGPSTSRYPDVRWNRESVGRASLPYSILTAAEKQEIGRAFMEAFPRARGEYRLQFSYQIPTLLGHDIVSTTNDKSYRID